MTPLYGAIEAGGTKFVCAVGTGPSDIRAQARFPTTTPETTMRQALEFLRAEQSRQGALAAVGIASFGPIDLHAGSPTYGRITSTPKPGWANTDVVGAARDALGVPVGFDTDVNAAALAEGRWGAAQGLHTFLYLTIGTGVGGGGLMDGRLMHGLVHPEMGHVRIPRDREADPFPGVCPFHGDCLEGLASGPAMQARWRQPAEELPDDHPAWALEARYLALALVNFVCTLSPQRIVMGGGVMTMPLLLPMIRQRVVDLLNSYVRAPEIVAHIDAYVVAPGLGARAGVMGGMALAERALETGAPAPGPSAEDAPAGVARSLASVSLLVRDYDEALAYFEGALGFIVSEDTDLGGGRRWLVVAPSGDGGTRVVLAKASTAAQAARVGNQTGGRVGFFLQTGNFGRDYEAMRSRGVRFLEVPRQEAYGTVAVFEDLYGNRWDLIEPRPATSA